MSDIRLYFNREKNQKDMLDKVYLSDKEGNKYDIFNLDKKSSYIIENDVDLSDLKLKNLPYLKNAKVMGDFNCSHNELLSLDGCPEFVGKDFNCSKNYQGDEENQKFCTLMTLSGGPKNVLGNYDCSNNHIVILEGAPEIIKGDFNCQKTNLRLFIEGQKK